MSGTPFEEALENLTAIQREAVDWEDGPLLVLAGPGSGKTQVLTCRVARLLDASRDKNFRVLALTFTNKAADEMKGRVANFVPGLEERANIGTFHSFCGQMLRQHGVHLGIKPDFAIYALDADRKAVLEDALRRASAGGQDVSLEDMRHLALIDRMKARLIGPQDTERTLARVPNAKHIALVYQTYEDELRRVNALDFNSLILEAHRLSVTFPAIAARYRRIHPYWLLDEFQDTNNAQYWLIRALAGDEFKNLFAVADDDQIIYQWNGASFRQIQSFLADFKASVTQLPTNYRCPPAIVEAANRLVVYNAQRTASKKPLIAGKTKLKLPAAEHLQTREFETDDDEANGIAREIARRGKNAWGEIRVLARTRASLEKMHAALQHHQVPAIIAQRRDDFLSAEFRWFVACLSQTVRPLDRRTLSVLAEGYNRIANIAVSADEVIADAESSGRSYFATWLEEARNQAGESPKAALLDIVATLAADPSSARSVVDKIVAEFGKAQGDPAAQSDLTEDLAAWREIFRDIATHIGRTAPLDQFLQELQLRSKEPSPKPGTVTLTTIHGAKGGEFDCVYVVGLAEDVMPSFQSKQKGDQSPEMEEERRNCFVAITRAKECLILSRAKSYRGWQKQPSRFLVEMGLIGPTKNR
jgi:DNA helicase-2/ATP-dependent DNA helicase PcrA